MRLCSFRGPDGPRPGLVQGDAVVPLAAASSLEGRELAITKPTPSRRGN